MVENVKKVLVTDDSTMIRIMLSSILEEEGYQVETASNGIDAYQKIIEFQPDFVFLDYQMPEEDGIDVLIKVKSNPSLNKIPVVLLTGISERDKKFNQYCHLANFVMNKNFQPENIKKVILEISKKQK